MSEFAIIGGEDTKQTGIFFRLPIQKTMYIWYGNDGETPMYPQGINKILNVFRMKKAKEHAECDNAYGFDFYEFCFPIFFSRKGCKVIAIRKSDIISVVSEGYEGYKNHCAGECVTEVTTITYRENGLVKRIKMTNKGKYKFTYKSAINELVH